MLRDVTFCYTGIDINHLSYLLLPTYYFYISTPIVTILFIAIKIGLFQKNGWISITIRTTSTRNSTNYFQDLCLPNGNK